MGAEEGGLGFKAPSLSNEHPYLYSNAASAEVDGISVEPLVTVVGLLHKKAI